MWTGAKKELQRVHDEWNEQHKLWRNRLPGGYEDEISAILTWYGFRVIASVGMYQGYDSDYRWLVETPGGRLVTYQDGGCSCWEPMDFEDFLMFPQDMNLQEIMTWNPDHWSSNHDREWVEIMQDAILSPLPYGVTVVDNIDLGVWAKANKARLLR